MNFKEFHENLISLGEPEYQTIQSNIIPNISKEKIIGIRLPKLIRFAKKNIDEKFKKKFLKHLPHKYLEEDLIHVWLINKMENYDECIKAVKVFLPYVKNWEISDSFMPKAFRQNADELIDELEILLKSDSTYTVRFAILMMLKFYLDENYDKKYLQWVADIRSDEYYIEMMAGWFFTEALIKHYDDAIIFLEKRMLYPKIHTKTIQKAVETRRLTDEQKEYLKTLRRRYW